MVKPFLVFLTLAPSRGKRASGPPDHDSLCEGPFISLQHSLSTMPGVCGMMCPIGNLPERMQRRCEAAVAAIQTRRRTAAVIWRDATRDHASPARGPRQGGGSVRAVPGLNLLPGGRQDGKGIYD